MLVAGPLRRRRWTSRRERRSRSPHSGTGNVRGPSMGRTGHTVVGGEVRDSMSGRADWSSLQIRTLRPEADIRGLLHLLEAVEAIDGSDEAEDEAAVRATMCWPGHDPASDHWVMVDSERPGAHTAHTPSAWRPRPGRLVRVAPAVDLCPDARAGHRVGAPTVPPCDAPARSAGRRTAAARSCARSCACALPAR